MKEPEDLKMFNCPCGANFVGTVANFDQHLEVECPVYKEAGRILREKFGPPKDEAHQEKQ